MRGSAGICHRDKDGINYCLLGEATPGPAVLKKSQEINLAKARNQLGEGLHLLRVHTLAVTPIVDESETAPCSDLPPEVAGPGDLTGSSTAPASAM